MNRANLFCLSHTLSFMIFILASFSAWGLPSDKNETIHGSADNLIVDQKNGLATYSGTVKIAQGSLVIYADSIIIHTNPDSSIEKMVATGNPAQFQQQPDAKQGVVKAAAKEITYTPNDEHLLLIKNASVEQNGAVMRGPHIDYDLLREVMKAAGNSSADGNGQRIEIVIPPKNPQPDSSPAKNESP